MRGVFPVWAASLILVRDVLILIAGAVLAGRGLRIDVRWIGKVATFTLMIAIPGVAWGTLGLWPAAAALAIGWLAFVVGIVEYYMAAAVYANDRTSSPGGDVGRASCRRDRARGTIVREPGAARRTKAGQGRSGRGVPRGASLHEGTRVGSHGRRARRGSASPTSRRMPSATWSTSTCPRSGRGSRPTSRSVRWSRRSRSPTCTAPVAGTIVERNPLVDDRPELVNEQPYGDGWLVVLDPDDRDAVEDLLDAAAYRAFVERPGPSSRGLSGEAGSHRLRNRDFTPIDPWSSLRPVAGRGLPPRPVEGALTLR